MKIKLILNATKEGSNDLENIREEIFAWKENKLFLLPSPELFSKGTSLSVQIEIIDEEEPKT